jgi:hypothetical protein
MLTASGLPQGVTASFNPASTAGSSTLTLMATQAAAPTTATITITGTTPTSHIAHTTTTSVAITPVLSGTVPVDLSSSYNVTGIYNDGSTFQPSASLDEDGFAFSEQLLGREQVGDGVVFKLGPPGAPDVVVGKTVTLPAGKFSRIKMLAFGVNGHQEMQTFNVTYDDGSSSTFTQSLSDWASSRNFDGESIAVTMPYRITNEGSRDGRAFNAYAYSFNLDGNKVVRSISLPSNRYVLVLGITAVPAGK